MKFFPLFIALSLSLSTAMASELYKLKVKKLDGSPQEFSKFKNKVLLVVNTASACGYTPQFKGLQELYAKYKDKGLEVVGFPSDDFKQEKKAAKDLGEFCERNYGVKFTMLEIGHVKGKKQSPLYRYLQKNSKTPKEDVSWNFEKFLVDRKGKVVGRYKSAVTPADKSLNSAITKALAAK